jgi:hypothetical protein
MELITRLSGLLKAITYTIRVRFRINFKTVQMYENFVVQSSISSASREGLTGSFAAFGLALE